jgi:hypothetical protein
MDFKKECLDKKIIPNYAKINLKPVNDAAKTTIQKAEIINIKHEIPQINIVDFASC